MVEHDGAKMSKSLGNLVMVRDLLKEWSADAIRLYLGRHHYRQRWSHDMAELAEAGRLADTLRAAATVTGGSGVAVGVADAEAEFTAAMNRDLDTPAALRRLERLAGDVLAGARAGGQVQPAQALVRRLAKVFGLRLDAPDAEDRVIAGWNRHLARFLPAGA